MEPVNEQPTVNLAQKLFGGLGGRGDFPLVLIKCRTQKSKNR